MSWPDFWTQTTWKTKLLSPLSKWVCRHAQKRYANFVAAKQSKPSGQNLLDVCVVGNLVVGGSGKTPFIIWLVNELKQKGIKVGIVSRGYGGKSKTWPQLVTALSDPKWVGDEPVMLAKTLRVPVAVSPKRLEAVRLLSATTDCDWLISDDGLQHFAMPRKCEVVLVDAQRMFGNEYCLPAGPLREPIERLSQVDAWILNGSGGTLALANLCKAHSMSTKPLAEMHLQPVCLRNVLYPHWVLELKVLQGSEVDALAGIGNPQRFFQSLRDLGAKVSEHPFADHQAFSVEDLQKFRQFNRPVKDSHPALSVQQKTLENGLIMTHKDAVKCEPIAQQLQADNWWYLEISPRVDAKILSLIIEKMSAKNA